MIETVRFRFGVRYLVTRPDGSEIWTNDPAIAAELDKPSKPEQLDLLHDLFGDLDPCDQ